jgi:hypothetical protein
MCPPDPTENSEGSSQGDEKILTRKELSRVSDSISAEELERQVESTLDSFEEGFYLRHPALWWTTLVVPPALIAGALISVVLVSGWWFTVKLLGAAAATFFVLGRLVILMGKQGELDWDFLTPFELFVMVSYMDVAAALLVAFHVGVLFHMPWIGKRAASLVEDARFVLDKMPWMHNAAFVGLTLFVAFPLAATGAIGGSILGTLLGLNRTRVFIATITGCLIGNGLLYKASEFIRPIAENPWFKYSSLIVIVGLVALMEIRYRKSKKKYHDAHL